MTTRLGNVLARLSFGAIASMGLLALPIVGSHPVMAQNNGPAALAGTVSSPEEGKMEGVVVSAKRPGSTVMVSVSTNAQGQYSFPQDRLAPGAYDISIRAVGYTLKPTAATLQSGGSTQLDLNLAKAAPDVLALQMSNSEWIQSVPGAPGQKMALLRCLDCHGLQRPFFSKRNASDMACWESLPLCAPVLFMFYYGVNRAASAPTTGNLPEIEIQSTRPHSCAHVQKGEEHMNRRSIFTFSAIAALALALLPSSSVAQQGSLRQQLVGTGGTS